MRIEVLDALTGRTRCVLNLVTPELAEGIFDIYSRDRVRYIIQPDRTPDPACRDPRHGEPLPTTVTLP